MLNNQVYQLKTQEDFGKMKKSKLRDIIREQIFEILTEKLCKRGKAYIASRKRKGEKHNHFQQQEQLKFVKVKLEVLIKK